MQICLTLPFDGLSSTASFSLPYGMAVIASIIRMQYPRSDIFFSNDEDKILSADIIYCSGLSESWDLVNELGKKVTGQGKRFIVGGQHVTALPQTLLYGEGFRGPLEIVNKEWPNPLPDWTIFSKEMRESAHYTVMTSRGCPYQCRFCSSSAFWSKYTPLPIDRVIKEISQLANFGAKTIILFDDLFIADKKRLKIIVERIVAEGLNSINYQCLVRADSISDEVLYLLRKMNVTAAAFGAESGSNAMLQAMNKKTTRELNQTCIDLLLTHGYHPVCSLIAGFPGENEKTLDETLDFIAKNHEKCLMEVFPLQPLPGTWLWDYFMEKFSPSLENFPWASLSLRGNRVDWDSYHLLSDSCSKKVLRKFFKKVHNIKKPKERANGHSIKKVLKNILKYLRKPLKTPK